MKKLTQKHLLAPTALLTAGVALLLPLRARAAVNCDDLGVLKALPGICGAEDFNAVTNSIVTWLMGILGVVLAIVILASAVQVALVDRPN